MQPFNSNSKNWQHPFLLQRVLSYSSRSVKELVHFGNTSNSFRETIEFYGAPIFQMMFENSTLPVWKNLPQFFSMLCRKKETVVNHNDNNKNEQQQQQQQPTKLMWLVEQMLRAGAAVYIKNDDDASSTSSVSLYDKLIFEPGPFGSYNAVEACCATNNVDMLRILLLNLEDTAEKVRHAEDDKIKTGSMVVQKKASYGNTKFERVNLSQPPLLFLCVEKSSTDCLRFLLEEIKLPADCFFENKSSSPRSLLHHALYNGTTMTTIKVLMEAGKLNEAGREPFLNAPWSFNDSRARELVDCGLNVSAHTIFSLAVLKHRADFINYIANECPQLNKSKFFLGVFSDRRHPPGVLANYQVPPFHKPTPRDDTALVQASSAAFANAVASAPGVGGRRTGATTLQPTAQGARGNPVPLSAGLIALHHVTQHKETFQAFLSAFPNAINEMIAAGDFWKDWFGDILGRCIDECTHYVKYDDKTVMEKQQQRADGFKPPYGDDVSGYYDPSNALPFFDALVKSGTITIERNFDVVTHHIILRNYYKVPIVRMIVSCLVENCPQHAKTIPQTIFQSFLTVRRDVNFPVAALIALIRTFPDDIDPSYVDPSGKRVSTLTALVAQGDTTILEQLIDLPNFKNPAETHPLEWERLPFFFITSFFCAGQHLGHNNYQNMRTAEQYKNALNLFNRLFLSGKYSSVGSLINNRLFFCKSSNGQVFNKNAFNDDTNFSQSTTRIGDCAIDLLFLMKFVNLNFPRYLALSPLHFGMNCYLQKMEFAEAMMHHPAADMQLPLLVDEEIYKVDRVEEIQAEQDRIKEMEQKDDPALATEAKHKKIIVIQGRTPLELFCEVGWWSVCERLAVQLGDDFNKNHSSMFFGGLNPLTPLQQTELDTKREFAKTCSPRDMEVNKDFLLDKINLVKDFCKRENIEFQTTNPISKKTLIHFLCQDLDYYFPAFIRVHGAEAASMPMMKSLDGAVDLLVKECGIDLNAEDADGNKAGDVVARVKKTYEDALGECVREKEERDKRMQEQNQQSLTGMTGGFGGGFGGGGFGAPAATPSLGGGAWGGPTPPTPSAPNAGSWGGQLHDPNYSDSWNKPSNTNNSNPNNSTGNSTTTSGAAAPTGWAAFAKPSDEKPTTTSTTFGGGGGSSNSAAFSGAAFQFSFNSTKTEKDDDNKNDKDLPPK